MEKSSKISGGMRDRILQSYEQMNAQSLADLCDFLPFLFLW